MGTQRNTKLNLSVSVASPMGPSQSIGQPCQFRVGEMARAAGLELAPLLGRQRVDSLSQAELIQPRASCGICLVELVQMQLPECNLEGPQIQYSGPDRVGFVSPTLQSGLRKELEKHR